jgi:hypothetical protein
MQLSCPLFIVVIATSPKHCIVGSDAPFSLQSRSKPKNCSVLDASKSLAKTHSNRGVHPRNEHFYMIMYG